MDFMQMLQQLLSGGQKPSEQIQWGMNSGNVAPNDTLGNFINGIEATKTGGLGTNALDDGFGWNMGTAKLGMGALSSLGSLWGSYNQNKLANAQFDFSKQMATSNLNNQIKSYNTALTDRANTRAVMEGRDQNWADQYVNQNRLVK